MTLEFLSPLAPGAPAARSPMERDARAAGGRVEVRGGWHVAVDYGSVGGERAACRERAGWADVSHLGKLELQGAPDVLAGVAGVALEPGRGTLAAGARWCPLAPNRVLVLCAADAVSALRDRAEQDVAVVDVTTTFAALTVLGPLAREVLARLTALDLRPAAAPAGAFRPGSVARVPGMVLCEDHDRFIVLFGAALGRYVWTAMADAAQRLGGEPVGADALETERA